MRGMIGHAGGKCMAGLAAMLVASSLLAGPVLGAESKVLRARALELVNEARAQKGLDPLEQVSILNSMAQSHAEDMLQRDYYSHTTPEGDGLRERFLDWGGDPAAFAAENIAHCPECEPPLDEERVDKLHRGWMERESHRSNILSEGVTGFGYGLTVSDEGGLYAVQVFSGPGSQEAGASGGGTNEAGVATFERFVGSESIDPPATQLSPADQRARMISTINAARGADGLVPLQESWVLSRAAEEMLPSGGGGSLRLGPSGDVYDSLPDEERNNWRELSVVSATCTGCGAEITDADISSFRQQWMNNPQFAQTVMSSGPTHIGVTLNADGQGGKAAIAVVGTRR